jgi:hypothetical protein
VIVTVGVRAEESPQSSVKKNGESAVAEDVERMKHPRFEIAG